MSEQLVVSVSPNLKVRENLSVVMCDVIIALIPAIIASIYFFRLRAVYVLVVSIAASIASEFVSQKIMGRKSTISDLSAVLTGILFAFVIPPFTPLWVVGVGASISIILGKQIFGGLGHNPFNPALVGRAVLLASWPVHLTTWTKPFTYAVSNSSVDTVTTATPLAIIKEGLGVPLPSYMDLFIGNRAGCLGETSIFALLIGGLYLLFRKQITWHIPVFYIITVGYMSYIFGGDPVFHLLAGGLILGAVYMATDPVTSPLTRQGMVVFAVGCGLLTALIRFKGSFPEGVCYAILIMNMVTPIIDRYIRPKKFGANKAVNGNANG